MQVIAESVAFNRQELSTLGDVLENHMLDKAIDSLVVAEFWLRQYREYHHEQERTDGQQLPPGSEAGDTAAPGTG